MKNNNTIKIEVPELLTIVSVTHYVEDLEKNSELICPSVKLYDRTLSSLQRSFPETDDCKKVLVYDMPEDPDSKHLTYKQNLEEYCKQQNINLLIKHGAGLRRCVTQALKQVESKYTLFLEHDWELHVDESMNTILREFEINPKLKYLRFNKRVNKTTGDDKILKEAKSYVIPMMKTSTYSNNPHICETETYRKWLDIAEPSIRWITIAPYSRWRSLFWLFREIVVNQNRKADAIEHILSYYYEKKIEKQGFDMAHKEMGIYLYGEEGSGPYAIHLGE